VQFKELIEAVKGGEMLDESDLKIVTAKIFNPSSGVSFTPRKKARYADNSWEFAEVEFWETIKEGPDSTDREALQVHIGEQ
jgi:hypothetical protein